VDATDLSLTITTTGGDVMVCFHGFVAWTGNGVFLDVTLDGTRIGGDDGIIRGAVANSSESLAFVRLVQSVSAGAHTFKLQWKVAASAAATLYAGAGTSNFDLHPQFWAREVS
jgi:hypothetical protein